jgi:hypothetical protein
MTVPPTSDARSGSNANRLPPRSAIVVGILFMLCGAFPVLAGLGLLHGRPAPGVQPWVIVAAGSVFILAGLAVINGYALAGGSHADGDLSADAPFIARVTQYVLYLAIVGLLFAVFAWISFGPGERHFSSSMSIPGWSTSGPSSERSGRIAFGIATGLMGLFFVLSAVGGAKSLWRDSQRAPRVK